MKLSLTLKNRPFTNILNGLKKWEGRSYRGKYKKIGIGDVFEFRNCEDPAEKRTLVVQVTSVHIFPSFEDAFKMIDTAEAIPGHPLNECLRIYYGYYPKDTIKEGVVFFGIVLKKVISPD